MIAILDPLLFDLNRGFDHVSFDQFMHYCSKNSVEIVPFDTYWPALWSSFVVPLQRSELGFPARQTLQALQNHVKALASKATTSPSKTNLWLRGFRELFGQSWLAPDWEDRMARAVVAAFRLSDEVVVFTRRIPHRNCKVLAAGTSQIFENTRWVLHVQPPLIGHRQVKCVYHVRNFSVDWSIRLDWRLPATQDSAHYPYCPPPQWWKASTALVRTIQSKPCFVDAKGNGWACPNTPGEKHHWDVFITELGLASKLGQNHLNVTAYGSDDKGKLPGSLHHPGASGVPQMGGWSCP